MPWCSPDRPDYDFELGENGEVLAIHVEPRRIANRMVEESMIAANICAGRVLGKSVGYGIFNVHTGFDEESLDGAIDLLKSAEAPSSATRSPASPASAPCAAGSTTSTPAGWMARSAASRAMR